MTLNDATEQAYKNGYQAGLNDSVKQSVWVRLNPYTDTMMCEACGYNVIDEMLTTPYCPWCGCKMKIKVYGKLKYWEVWWEYIGSKR